jgi:DNA-binding XRE family transcriptional regulator
MNQPDETVRLVVEQLKKARKDLGLSHEAVAARVKLNRSAISLIEAGKRQPTLLTCLKIAQALDIELGAVITKAAKP